MLARYDVGILATVLLVLVACQPAATAQDRGGGATAQQQQHREYVAFLRSMLRDIMLPARRGFRVPLVMLSRA